NSSDLRNRAKLDEVLKPSTQQHSLFSKGKIILVDEVDGVTTTDYGGLAELVVLIERTKFPVIITCNDIWQNKFSLLRNKCEMVPIKEIPYLIILEYLKTIVKKENKVINENAIKEIAAKSRGDLRAALNDLQSILYSEESTIMQSEIDLREKAQDIFNALREVFKSRMHKKTVEAYDSVEMEIDQISLWVEENIPVEYQGIELAKAIDALSKADVFKGRIYRQQHWRFMLYQNFFLTAGISAAKGNRSMPDKFTKYNPPKRILKIWMSNQRTAKKKSIAGKLAELTHTSKKRAIRDFNILAIITDDNTKKQLNLSEDELEYLTEKRQEIILSLGKLTV
ncbi:MAG: hypothetical protein Q8L27_03505, partial [archaeon]|nr:hypothetical protein [archaeon]